MQRVLLVLACAAGLQGQPNCAYTVTPVETGVGPGGGTGKIQVAGADPRCFWAAVSNAPWIALDTTLGMIHGGSGSVTWTVPANPSTDSRRGTVTVANATVTLTQVGAGSAPVALTSVANAASHLQGVVAPGEILLLTGSGIGPADFLPQELTPDGQYATTSLGGTRVFFDGIPAPLLYASADRVGAVAPYGINGRLATEVKVEYRDNPSNVMMIAVAPAAPGVFTLDESGEGPGLILNADFSFNTGANPAARGSLVMIYGSGGGQTVPAGPDGKIAEDSAIAQREVTVTIGGQDAPVCYAGNAVGLISGVLQVVAQVPDAAAPGDAVPVLVRVGEYATQHGVTVAIGQ